MSSDERSICFIKNNSISPQSIFGNIMNTLKHFPKYFSDAFPMLYRRREIFVISWYCSWSFISLFLSHTSSNRLHRHLWRAHTLPFSAQSHRKADRKNNLYLLVLVPCCILNKGRCSSERLQRHHRRESHCRLVVIYRKHNGKLTVNNCSDAQVH